MLDELFCDPNLLSRTRSTATTVDVKISNDGANDLKSDKSDSSSRPAGISGAKSDKAAAADSIHGIVGTQPASVDSSAVMDEDTVKGKVKRDDIPSITKVGSTNKSRKLPDWLAGITAGGSSKGTTSRKRKTLSKTDSDVSTTEKSVSRDKDSDTLSSPPPPKKVRVDRLHYLHFEHCMPLVHF